MSESKTVYVKGGTNLFGLLGIVLVILKLAGIAPVAGWSWWLVTLPFWFGLAILAAIAAVCGLFFLGAWALDAYEKRQRNKARAKSR